MMRYNNCVARTPGMFFSTLCVNQYNKIFTKDFHIIELNKGKGRWNSQANIDKRTSLQCRSRSGQRVVIELVSKPGQVGLLVITMQGVFSWPSFIIMTVARPIELIPYLFNSKLLSQNRMYYLLIQGILRVDFLQKAIYLQWLEDDHPPRAIAHNLVGLQPHHLSFR